MFVSPWFAIAGLALAAGPVLIHLLNRQRYRVVPWAAMDFLRHAVRRSRRWVRLQDILLMLLRSTVLVVFGLAMARPLVPGSGVADPRQPVHAVLVVDNSLSMGFEQLQGTVLDRAKSRARELIERLPPGSRISVLPAAGSAGEFNRGAYSTTEEALEALQSLEVVDRASPVPAALELAQAACQRVSSPPSKQIYLVSDQQAANWPSDSPEVVARLAGPLHVVQVAPRPEERENAWVADVKLQDELADLQTPAMFLASLRFEGQAPRHGVQVALTVDGVTVATQTVDLQPGQTREVRFPPYQFTTPVEPGQVAFVPVAVSIPHDRLPADDQRFLAVPVVASLPVVFVDQYGPDESPSRNRFGETFRLRRLLAPVTARHQTDKPLVEIRHVRMDRLDRQMLHDARLVVIAGVSRPDGPLDLLRQYVQQGGPLVLACGGDFDPAAWTELAWQEGQGILPLPLRPQAVGGLPGSSVRVKPFQLDVSTLVHEYFVLEQASREELEELYRLPFFFQAVEADASSEVLDRVVANVERQCRSVQERLAVIDKRLAELAAEEARGTSGEAQRQEQARLARQREELRPEWLIWARGRMAGSDTDSSPQAQAQAERPQVLARYTNGLPFLIERRLGRGRVLFVTTGVFRQWNTLTATNAAVLFDRIFRDLLRQTLPERNVDTSRSLVVPLAEELRSARFTLEGPQGQTQSLSAEAIGPHHVGLRLPAFAHRGIYRLTALATPETPQAARGTKLWETVVAVNGPAEESDLKALEEVDLRDRLAGAECRWVAEGETLSFAAASVLGRDLWQWLLGAALLGLLVELVILAWPLTVREQAR